MNDTQGLSKNPSAKNRNLPESTPGSSQRFIPDFCQANALLLLLILTQLLAFVFSMLQSNHSIVDWERLGLNSIFCHATVLCCSALICSLRNTFSKLSATAITTICLSIIVATTTVLTLSSQYLTPGNVPERSTTLLIQNIIISLIIGSLLLRYLYLQHQWRQQKQAELTARLQALQARIRPHFLFNSMNTIASLIAIDPEKAEEAILDLSTLFRATLNNQAMLIPLEEELDLCKRYLNIEGLRLGDRLQLEWKVAEDLNKVRIPPLTLQPLVENAIYHGIQPLKEGGTIKLESYQKEGNVTILITNPHQPDEDKHQGNQIALENIRSRLSGIFNQNAILKTSRQDNLFTVTLRFPGNN